jgi:hypothetical protein
MVCDRIPPIVRLVISDGQHGFVTGQTQRVKLEDYLSESIQCHGGSAGESLGTNILILDIDGELDLF